MEEPCHNLARGPCGEWGLQHDETEDDGHVDIDEHEGPECQHVVDPRAVDSLAGESHDDGEHDGIAHRRNSSVVGRKEAEGIDAAAQQVHGDNHRDEARQHKAIGRPGEGIPYHRADGQLKQQSGYDEASANDEAFLHVPRFIPHKLLN